MGSISALSTTKIDGYWKIVNEKCMDNIMNMFPHNCVERLVITCTYWWLVSSAPSRPCFRQCGGFQIETEKEKEYALSH